MTAHLLNVGCQLGRLNIVCKDGPVFHYPVIKPWLGQEGL